MRLLRLIGKLRKVRSSRAAVRWLFLRALGAVYLIAFTSLRVQVLGLYGSRGIQPIRELLAALRAQAGRDAYQLAPSLLWLGSSDRDLVRLCRAGQLCALALLVGVAPGLMSVAAWALYLSFVSVGRGFLSFQWDALLLETGLHAALVARTGQPRWLASVLLRWLVFRLHFQSGFVKLQSQDATWRRFTACAYHYETQPLPTRLGWYAHHLPRPVHRASTAAALAIELGAPFLVLAPPRGRKLGFSALTGLQALIAATGNYAFFNVLTVALTAWMLDDDSFQVLHRLARLDRRPARRRRGALARACGWTIYGALATVLAIASTLTFAATLRRRPLRTRLLALNRLIDPFRSVNPYGLFAVMTTSRPEIVIEGSNDGAAWREYPFRYKPSRPEDAPRLVAPHQPRLDWQMWFAALRPPPTWFVAFLGRLLAGSPDVLKLLGANPFPDQPPRYVRALLYEYRTTDLETKRRTGAWWQREGPHTYLPQVSLRSQ
jgi:hypothetical protein